MYKEHNLLVGDRRLRFWSGARRKTTDNTRHFASAVAVALCPSNAPAVRRHVGPHTAATETLLYDVAPLHCELSTQSTRLSCGLSERVFKVFFTYRRAVAF